MENTIIILREDFDHVVKKTDVWLVYTTKSNRPWVCVPNGIIYGETEITLFLAIKGGENK